MLSLKILKTVGKRKKPFRLDVNLQLDPAKTMTVFFGPSGSGKTLAMSCIAGLVTPDQGFIGIGQRIVFDSVKKINVKPQDRHVGYMPQDYGLFPNLTLLENVAYPKSGLFGRFLKKSQKMAAHALIERFGLSGLENHLPGELSGGQKQRASLARALNAEPALLLLDEPFSALDPLLRRQLRAQMLEILASLSLPLVVITHDPDDVDAFGQSVALFMQGRACLIDDYQQERKKFSNAAACLQALQRKFQPEA